MPDYVWLNILSDRSYRGFLYWQYNRIPLFNCIGFYQFNLFNLVTMRPLEKINPIELTILITVLVLALMSSM
jgi:hypothetical protein